VDKLAHPPELKKVDALDAYPPYAFRNDAEKLEEKKKELLATSH